MFTKDLDLPRGSERRTVRERDRVYEIDGTESRMLATIGAFRGNGKPADDAEIETIVEVADLTSQSAVERVPAVR